MSLDCIPISFPLQPFQQSEAQPTATLGVGEVCLALISKATESSADDIPSSAGEKSAMQCCHAAANTAQPKQAGTGGCQDSRAVARRHFAGRQDGNSSVLNQTQLRLQSNDSTSVPVQDKKSSLNELAVQVYVLSLSTSS